MTMTGPKISSFQSSSFVLISLIIVGAKKEPFERSKPSRGEGPVSRSPPIRIVPEVRDIISEILCSDFSEMTVPMADFGLSAVQMQLCKHPERFKKDFVGLRSPIRLVMLAAFSTKAAVNLS